MSSRSCRRLDQSRNGECDVGDYQQRFGKTLDEDVKMGVIFGADTALSAEPLPFEFIHLEERRAGQDDAV